MEYHQFDAIERAIGIVATCGKVVNISSLSIFKIPPITTFMLVTATIPITTPISIDEKFFISIFRSLNRGMANATIAGLNKLERMFPHFPYTHDEKYQKSKINKS